MSDVFETTILQDMIGRTAIAVETVMSDVRWSHGKPVEMLFRFDDGSQMRFRHDQECDEEVFIEDVCGDLADLVGSPLLVAEERAGESIDVEWGTETWTFYTFRTIKGSVDIRWLGRSNGYYGERVDYTFIPARKELE